MVQEKFRIYSYFIHFLIVWNAVIICQSSEYANDPTQTLEFPQIQNDISKDATTENQQDLSQFRKNTHPYPKWPPHFFNYEWYEDEKSHLDDHNAKKEDYLMHDQRLMKMFDTVVDEQDEILETCEKVSTNKSERESYFQSDPYDIILKCRQDQKISLSLSEPGFSTPPTKRMKMSEHKHSMDIVPTPPGFSSLGRPPLEDKLENNDSKLNHFPIENSKTFEEGKDYIGTIISKFQTDVFGVCHIESEGKEILWTQMLDSEDPNFKLTDPNFSYLYINQKVRFQIDPSHVKFFNLPWNSEPDIRAKTLYVQLFPIYKGFLTIVPTYDSPGEILYKEDEENKTVLIHYSPETELGHESLQQQFHFEFLGFDKQFARLILS